MRKTRVHSDRELEHGDKLLIVYDGGSDQGIPVKYLTTENVGHGRQWRVKDLERDRHFHVSPGARDVKTYKVTGDFTDPMEGFERAANIFLGR